MNAHAPASCTHWPSDCDGEVVIVPPQFSGSHLINGRSSKLLNSSLCSFGFGAEGAAACWPRATPWVSESIGAPCKGAGILRPCRADEVPRTRSRGVAPGWHAPRRWRVNVAEFSLGETCDGPNYEIGSRFKM